MTDVLVDPAAVEPTETPQEEKLPLLSPRQQALNEIVSQTEGQHAADNQTFRETVQEVDENGRPLQVVEAVAEEPVPTEGPVAAGGGEGSPSGEQVEASPPAPTDFDPAKEYELTVDGHKVMVKGEKIIEMGRRSLQKEAAADLRLSLASRILEEAKQRSAQMLPQQQEQARQEQPAPQGEGAFDEMKLAEAIQFGSREEAAAAVKELSSRRGEQVTPDQVMNFVRGNLSQMVAGELEFNKAAEFVSTEYADLMAKPKLKQLFFIEEQRLRQAGDRRPYKELYKAIGDDIRQDFNLKPISSAPTNGKTMEQRREEKARTTPTVPRTAAARLDSPAATKPPSQLDILNQMRAARKQPQLNG